MLYLDPMKRPSEAYRSNNLFEVGCGYVVVSRFKANGRVEAGFFLLDVFCLGVKDAGFEPFSSYEEFESDLLDPLFAVNAPVRMKPESGRKASPNRIAPRFSPSASMESHFTSREPMNRRRKASTSCAPLKLAVARTVSTSSSGQTISVPNLTPRTTRWSGLFRK
jgi:hypothetical protein